MKQFLPDVHHECLVCRVPNECKPGHQMCGISRGINLGIYPKDAHSSSSTGLPNGMSSGRCGFPDRSLFAPSDGMMEFCSAVAKMDERKLFRQKC